MNKVRYLIIEMNYIRKIQVLFRRISVPFRRKNYLLPPQVKRQLAMVLAIIMIVITDCGCENTNTPLQDSEQSETVLSVSDFVTANVIGVSAEQVHAALGDYPSGDVESGERYERVDLSSIVKDADSADFSIRYDSYGKVESCYMSLYTGPGGFGALVNKYDSLGYKCTEKDFSMDKARGREWEDYEYINSEYLINDMCMAVSERKSTVEVIGNINYEVGAVHIALRIDNTYYYRENDFTDDSNNLVELRIF